MVIGFLEWNQRNSDTERRTFWPNLWVKVGVGWGGPLVGWRWWVWERHASWTSARTEWQCSAPNQSRRIGRTEQVHSGRVSTLFIPSSWSNSRRKLALVERRKHLGSVVVRRDVDCPCATSIAIALSPLLHTGEVNDRFMTCLPGRTNTFVPCPGNKSTNGVPSIEMRWVQPCINTPPPESRLTTKVPVPSAARARDG